MTCKLALIQMNANIQKTINEDRICDFIRSAASQGASLICLQELCLTQYFCKDHSAPIESLADSVPGPFSDRLSSLAKELSVVIAAPFAEVTLRGVYYNSVMMIDSDGTLLGTYRKVHIPDDPGFHEKYYFRPGDNGYKVFDTSAGRVGVLICWDQWFPEAARILSLKGADLLLYPTAIGTLEHETSVEKAEFKDAWITIQRSHAIANGVFVAAVNRTGTEGGTEFWGNSFVCSPFGKMLMEAGEEEGVYLCDIDTDSIGEVRKTWPFLRDRRTDTYGEILGSDLEK